MTKKSLILIFLLLVIFILILYLILTSESVKKIEILNPELKNANSALLEINYEAKAKEIFIAYNELAQNNTLTAEKIAELKTKLLDLKMPSKFKDLHLNFVLALTKMENYLNLKDQEEKNASQRIFNQLKADYSWLNI